MTGVLIQCVVVLYQQSPAESIAISSLRAICLADAETASQIHILVQDNSPSVQEFALLDAAESCEPFALYHQEPGNPGLPDAYNRALKRAIEHEIPWLLLLDQDTAVTLHFLEQLRGGLERADASSYCAFVPQLVQGSLVLSPQIVGKVLYRRIPYGYSGFIGEPVVAFNSAACIRVEAMAAIGGFPSEFWLDYLDHMVFHRLQQGGGRIFILDAQLEHSLSLVEIESVSDERYASILRAEWLFVRRSGWGGGVLVHRLRLLKRATSHLLKLRNKGYARQTLHAVLS